MALVERGLAPSRARARDLIRRGFVELDGRVQTKPGTMVAAVSSVRLKGVAEARHVSRAAEKLEAALEYFRFAVAGVTALDIGASTGGFTEALLACGAARVYAVDVGHGQLHARVAGDPRVISLEGCDARSLDRVRVPESIGAVVADVSFVSLIKVLPAALALTSPGAWLVALIKPQFEVGREAVGKRGIVRDAAARQRAVESVSTWMAGQAHWRVLGVVASPIEGGSGNQEFLLGAIRDG
jgi:23S rRNA (cytidine1920-2'-O)/16S rRNA (cytidine1409-2'-O)-methyltransferase